MKVWKAFRILVLSASMFALTSCNLIPYALVKKDAQIASKEKEIAALKSDYEQKLDSRIKEIQAANLALIESLKMQMVGGGNAFYAQQLLFNTIPEPTRTDILFHNYGEEGWIALGHTMPTYEKMLEINERLKNELDATKTSLADLQKNHLAVVNANQKLVDGSKALSDKITSLNKDIENLKNDYGAKLTAKGNELQALKDEKLALETARADDAAAIHAAKMKFSLILGAIALAALAGAIWSPVWKDKCAIFSGVCGAAAVAIWYITPFIVGAIFSVIAVALIAWAFYKFHTSNKANDNYVGMLDDMKTSDPALYAQVQPFYTAWQTKYVKNKDGTITTVPDKAVLKLVDTKLVDTNKK